MRTRTTADAADPPSVGRVARRAILCLLAFLPIVLILPARDTSADPVIAVVTHKGGDTPVVDKNTLANIYRRKTLVDKHGRIYVPANLPAMHPLRRAFSRVLFEQPPEDMESYWNEQYFHGISPPFVLASVEAMIRFVAATPGAIGYIPDCRQDDRTQALMMLSLPPVDEGWRDLCDEKAPRLPE